MAACHGRIDGSIPSASIFLFLKGVNMHEIKYRAPELITGQYVYFTLKQLGQTATCEIGLSLDLSKSEQFTGLRDKNGKEIYEGDIVKSEDAPGMKDEISAVIWHENEACFYIENDELNIYDPIYNVTGYCTVIGNIHENPELLT